jgi:hypothetical protein
MTAKISNLKQLWKTIRTAASSSSLLYIRPKARADVLFSRGFEAVSLIWKPQHRRDDNIKPDI